jgi:hypothetical protein
VWFVLVLAAQGAEPGLVVVKHVVAESVTRTDWSGHAFAVEMSISTQSLVTIISYYFILILNTNLVIEVFSVAGIKQFPFADLKIKSALDMDIVLL